MKYVILIALIAIAWKSSIDNLGAIKSINGPEDKVKRLTQLLDQYQSELSFAKDSLTRNNVVYKYYQRINSFLTDSCHSVIDSLNLHVDTFAIFRSNLAVGQFSSGPIQVQYSVLDDDPNFPFVKGLKNGDNISARVIYTGGLGLHTSGNEHHFIIEGAIYPVTGKFSKTIEGKNNSIVSLSCP
jgi:hypothetical protein